MKKIKLYHHKTASLFNPLYLPAWLSIAILKLISMLPLKPQRKIGQALGKIAYYLLKERRLACKTNIKLCFPELNQNQQQNLVKENFKYLGIGFIESAFSWFSSDKKIEPLIEFKNIEYFEQCLNQKKGILVLAPHNYCLEIIGRFLSQKPFNITPTFRHIKNPVFNYVMQKSRTKIFNKIFFKSNVRDMIKALKDNSMLWNAADQDFGRDHSIFAPFFNVDTATITSLSKISKITKAPILPIDYYFDENLQKYIIAFNPPLEQIPTGDFYQDAKIINSFFEKSIKLHPEQYFWVHKRFKTRPIGSPEIYYKNTITNNKFQKIIEKSQVIKKNKHGPKLLLNQEHYIKIFYKKSGMSSTKFKSYADKFIINSIKLQKLNISTIKPEKVFYIKNHNHPRDPHFITYKSIPGQDLRNIITNNNSINIEDNHDLILRFIEELVTLHQKGVFFRSLHLGNILLEANSKNLALIDIADVRFKKLNKPLGFNKSLRNIKHIFNDPNDFQVWLNFGHNKFIDIYSEYRNVSNDYTCKLKAQLK
tara:strand:- start:10569 stop:12176 length:1608 start_codon:yes stop_codon:yes gene_type:complete